MSRKLGLSREQYKFLGADHDAIDQFELLFDYGNNMADSLAGVAQLSGITVDTDPTLAADSDVRVASQKATKEYVDTVALNVGTKVTVSNGGVVNGSVTLPIISVNETGIIWYSVPNGNAINISFPATGTFIGERLQTYVSGFATINAEARYGVAGGSSFSNVINSSGFSQLYKVTYTRTA